jgi:3-dehydroquinate synthase
MERLAAERLPLYAASATWRVNAEQPMAVTVTQIAALVAGATVIPVAGEPGYNILIGRGIVDQVGAHLAEANKVAIFYPAVMAKTAATLAATLTEPIMVEVPDSELAKTPEELLAAWRTLAKCGLTRSDAVVGLGGGTTTDLAGFVAATYLRGINFISVPTTVLGMADAGLGGKTGVNIPEGKNLVGAFHEPKAVICDLDLLASLDPFQVRSGLAEIVKAGFIADPTILDLVEPSGTLPKGTVPNGSPPELLANCDPASSAFQEMLTRAIQVKAAVVGADFRELGVNGQVGRAALNYGHTLGHAIERLEDYTWLHGDAISIGMVFAAEVASLLGLIDEALVARHRQILAGLRLPTSYAASAWPELRAVMSLDKKARGNQLRMVLLEGLGQPKIVAEIDEAILAAAYQRIEA